jgi:formylglycine-generating enzyme required for sulfatase activity/predicted Ser/Thr protein kinase
MSDSSALSKSCPKCGASLPSEATEGLCPACLMAEAMKPSAPAKGPWQPPTAEELHQLLPQYEITALLGRGGMGAVYKGRQIALDRPVAIKILSNTLEEADASFAERFKNEARALGKLSHPGIVAVYDFGEAANGLLYIVMEFIDGTDVARMIANQKRLHTEHAMAITAHVCDALAYAHERGIIHRDIKPANIMVGYDGVVKVADFGLAKMSTGGESAGLTQSGMAMGTLHYMAPEALMLGSAVDHRADIYAVGVMLYQMLTGKVPHGMFELPSMQVPGLDPRYDGIIAKAMREDREVRYQAAVELRLDLDAILTQPVVKVESDAEKAPAALETQARPQRPGGQPNRPPQPEVIVRTEKKSAPLLWVGFIAMACLAAWLGLKKSGGESTPELGGAAGAPAAGSGPSVTSPPNAALGGPSAPPSAASPAEATKEVPFSNTLGMKFVPVPIAGGPASGKTVLFSIWETRVQDYEVFVVQTKREWPAPDPSKSADHPVMNVRWQDAKAFADWLTTQERQAGKIAANAQYRLPSDHEWSCAAGIGTTEDAALLPDDKSRKLPNSYPWGSSWPPPSRSGNYRSAELSSDADDSSKTDKGEKASAYEDGHATQAPVGSYAPNALGLYDLGGNLWEWCEDWVDASGQKKVLRGGGWDVMRRDLLASSYRHRSPPDNAGAYYGFRLVLEVSLSSESLKSVAKTPAQATKDAPFVNTLGMKFVPVPDTQVLFCIHETRRQDYAAYALETSGLDDSWKTSASEKDGIPVSPQNNHPVVMVSWDDAQKFCEWLGKKEGRRYRLPTDEEWSHAVGIGGKEASTKDTMPEALSGRLPNEYPWGNSFPPDTGNALGNYADVAWHEKFPQHPWIAGYADGFSTTAPVMSFKPNLLGIHDLGGNVYEWCEDWSNAAKTERVLRGGSWNEYRREALASSWRHARPPGLRTIGNSFRCVLEVSAPTVAAFAHAVTGKPLDAKPTEAVIPKSTTPPTAATKDAPFVNTLGMKFVPVPDTKVLFCIHETRRQDYVAYATQIPSVDSSWRRQQRDGVPSGHEDTHPVVGVNWEDARAFCSWLGQKEGLTYRLPTDMQWSFAAGIRPQVTPQSKLSTTYPWGENFPPKSSDQPGNYGDSAWKEKFPARPHIEGFTDGFATTAPVMTFKPNNLGLHDLGGNVMEWVNDAPSGEQRMLRGASFHDSRPDYMLSDFRAHRALNARDINYGFRCVLELPVAVVASTPPLSPTLIPNPEKSATVGATQAPRMTTAKLADALVKQPVPITLPVGPTAWTDTQGRTITATFKTIASGNVLLEIAGKVTPVALNTLSAESQKLARDYQQQTQATQSKIVASDPAKATKDVPFTNTLGMKFVPVPGTKVLFCIHETRRQDYAAYAAEVSGVDSSWQNQERAGIPAGREDNEPVVSVVWDDADAFCLWLSKKEGRTFRLPTDREWSFAVGVGRDERWTKDTTPEMLHCQVADKFPWGGDYPPKSKDQAGNYNDLTHQGKFPTEPTIAGYIDGYAMTAPVMSYKSNKLGIYDLGGNVWEWVGDWFNAEQKERVLRGASFGYWDPSYLLSSCRFRQPPASRLNSQGFRVVLDITQP